MVDKELAPNLRGSTFQEVSKMLEDLLAKEAAESPKELAILEHSLVLINWYLADSDKAKDEIDGIFKVSEEVLHGMGFDPEEVIAINVFFRKRKPVLEDLKTAISAKMRKGVKINAGM